METRQGHGLKDCYGPGFCEQDCNVQKPGHHSAVLYSTSIVTLLDTLKHLACWSFYQTWRYKNWKNSQENGMESSLPREYMRKKKRTKIVGRLSVGFLFTFLSVELFHTHFTKQPFPTLLRNIPYKDMPVETSSS